MRLFKCEIEEFSSEVTARMLLFDKDDRINGIFDIIRKRTNKLFFTGVMLLICGVFIIFLVLFLAYGHSVDNISIVSGLISGIIIDFIGAVFIGIYNKTEDSSMKLSQLINNNRRANFGHYLASQIDDKTLRDQTFSMMATESLREIKPD